MANILLQLSPVALYLLSALFAYWSRLRVAGGVAQSVVPVPAAGLTRWSKGFLLCALLLHGGLLHMMLFPEQGMHFGFSLAASLMIWLAICFYWIEAFYTPMDGFLIFVVPAGIIACVLPLIFPAQYILEHVRSDVFRVHFIIAMLAYSLFVLAMLHAMMMVVAEKQLRLGKLDFMLKSLPPLLILEKLLFRLIGIAFILLTLTLVTGMVYSREVFGVLWRFDHKSVFSVAAWLVFGVLLLGRQLYGWRGKIALRWTIAGFVALLLAYLGSRFVLEYILKR